MPVSSPSALTTNYSLKKYLDGDNPGAAALNSNLDTIDTEIKAVSDGLITGVGYTEFCARITQTGTSAPTVTVLKNTTGATVSSVAYQDVGAYGITMSANVFTTAGSSRKCEVAGYSDGGQEIVLKGYVAFTANLTAININTSLLDLTPTDAILTADVNYILEIRTYP